MNPEQFNLQISKNDILLAYFSHDECNVCKVLRPRVERLIAELPEVAFEYINTVQAPEIAGQYIVFAVPTIIVFVNGKENRRFSRYFSIDELRTVLVRYQGK